MKLAVLQLVMIIVILVILYTLIGKRMTYALLIYLQLIINGLPKEG